MIQEQSSNNNTQFNFNVVYKNQPLYCQNKNQSEMICIQNNCKQYAPICIQKNCSCRKTKHLKCAKLSTEPFIQQLLDKRITISQEVQKSFSAIVQIYDQLLDQLSIQKEKLLKWKQNYGLSPYQINFLDIIHEKKNQLLTGDSVFKIKNKLQEKNLLQMAEFQVRQVWKKQKQTIKKALSRINYMFVLNQQDLRNNVNNTLNNNYTRIGGDFSKNNFINQYQRRVNYQTGLSSYNNPNRNFTDEKQDHQLHNSQQ